FRAKFHDNLRLFGKNVVVDWSVPIPEVDPEVMKDVKIIYLRNLPVCEDRQQLEQVVTTFVAKDRIEKLYKFKNYAFIHLKTRIEAEILIKALQEYYKNEPVDVEWAKPVNKFTTPEYRQQRVEAMSTGSRSRNSSQSSTASGSSSGRSSAKKIDLVCTSQVLNISDLPKEILQHHKLRGNLPQTATTTPSSSVSPSSVLSPVSSTNESLFSSSLSASNSLDNRSFSPFSPSSTSSPNRMEHSVPKSSRLEENKRMSTYKKILDGAIKVPPPVEFMNNAVKNKRAIPLVFGQLPCAVPDTTYMNNWKNSCVYSSGLPDSTCNACGFMKTS
ncbi:unnamed protein product, partial [Callosobruchus maculatus]